MGMARHPHYLVHESRLASRYWSEERRVEHSLFTQYPIDRYHVQALRKYSSCINFESCSGVKVGGSQSEYVGFSS